MGPDGYGVLKTALEADESIVSFSVTPVPKEGEDIGVFVLHAKTRRTASMLASVVNTGFLYDGSRESQVRASEKVLRV